MIPSQTRLSDIETAVEAAVPPGYRRLKRDEVVAHGDYVMDEQQQIQLWEGPGGFHASSFWKPIYRREKSVPPVAAGKSK